MIVKKNVRLHISLFANIVILKYRRCVNSHPQKVQLRLL